MSVQVPATPGRYKTPAVANKYRGFVPRRFRHTDCNDKGAEVMNMDKSLAKHIRAKGNIYIIVRVK